MAGDGVKFQPNGTWSGEPSDGPPVDQINFTGSVMLEQLDDNLATLIMTRPDSKAVQVDIRATGDNAKLLFTLVMDEVNLEEQ